MSSVVVLLHSMLKPTLRWKKKDIIVSVLSLFMIIIMYTMSISLYFVLLAAKILPRIEILNFCIAGQEVVIENAHIIINCLTRMVSYPHTMVCDSFPKFRNYLMLDFALGQLDSGLYFVSVKMTASNEQRSSLVPLPILHSLFYLKVIDRQMITLLLCLPCMC